jgi:hypothetical protein
MRSGALSYSKVRALTRVATPENEAELLAFARAGSASHVERLVRAWRRVDRLEDAEQQELRHESRELVMIEDDDGMVVIRGRLAPEVAAVFAKALEVAEDAMFKAGAREAREVAEVNETDDTNAPHPDRPTAGQRRADAIGWVAEAALRAHEAGSTGGRSSGDRYQVVVHVEAEVGTGELEDGAGVPAGTSRRLACDASRVTMTHAPDGSVLSVGRKTRTVPPAIRRALSRRDRGHCQFPGCSSRYCDAHHVRHWAQGGETKLDNLILLCHFHHRAVHEGGYTVELGASDARSAETGGVRPKPAGVRSATSEERSTARRAPAAARFYRPDGRRLPQVPDPPRLDGPADRLERHNRARGIRPGPDSTLPAWHGETPDYGWAISAWR